MILTTLLVSIAAPAHAGTLYSVPAAGGKPTVIVRSAGTSFGPLCRRADGAIVSLTETRGRRRFGTFVAGAKPRWQAADEYVLGADFSPGCASVAEVHYVFEDDRRGRGGVLVRSVDGRSWRAARRSSPANRSASPGHRTAAGSR